MMDNDTHRKVRRGLTALAAGVVVSVALTVSPAMAQDPEEGVFLADGVWEAVMASRSTVTAGGGGGAAEFRGTASFLSADGLLEGTWSVGGTGEFVSADSRVTGEYIAEGNVTGDASLPRFPATSLYLAGTAMIDGVAHPVGPLTLGPDGGGAINLILTHATCSQVLGRWEYAAGPLDAGGTFVATRVEDLVPGAETDYEAEVTDLIGDAIDFRETTITSGSVDAGALDGLINRAQNLYRSIRRATECDPEPPRDADAFLSLIAGVIAELVRFAIANPSLFSDGDLLALTNALVNTGAGTPEMVEALVNEWARRLVAAVEAGDSHRILFINSGAAVLGGWDVVADGEAALADE